MKCNQISLRISDVNAAIENHLIQAMEKAEDKLIDLMREEIQRTTHGQAPGHPLWRNEISRLLKETYRVIGRGYMEFEAGVPYDVAENVLVKAMIIAVGSGDAVGNPAIQAGPPGREVWDGSMEGKRPSQAESTYLLPAAFNQKGNEFVKNAVIRMKVFFDEILDAACATLPSSVFYGNVIVSKGG